MRSRAAVRRDLEDTLKLYGWEEWLQAVGVTAEDEADKEPAPTPRPDPVPGQTWSDGLVDCQVLTVDRQRRRLVVCEIAVPTTRVGYSASEAGPVLVLVEWDWCEGRALVDGEGSPWLAAVQS